MGSHQSSRMLTDVWLTPRWITDLLGPFDLDPCAAPPPRPWETARRNYLPADNGLALPWRGTVWLNPPYSREAEKWLARMGDHNNGIALTFARTETGWFWDSIWERAAAIYFLRGRLHFHRADGSRAEANAGAPSVIVGYGEAAMRLARLPDEGGRLIWNVSRRSARSAA